MKPRVVYRREVNGEVREAFEWYQQRSRGLGWEFALCVEEAIERIREAPEAYPISHGRTRFARVRRFPYAVFYVPKMDLIVVTAVYHTSRDRRSLRRRR